MVDDQIFHVKIRHFNQMFLFVNSKHQSWTKYKIKQLQQKKRILESHKESGSKKEKKRLMLGKTESKTEAESEET